MRPARIGFAFALFLTIGCAPIPTPRVIDEADALARGSAVRAAKAYSQTEWSYGEKRRLEAHEAASLGQHSRAQFLGEESIAHYTAAVHLAELARATERLEAAEARLSEEARLQDELDGELARTSATVTEFEKKIAVFKRATSEGENQSSQAHDQALREAAQVFAKEGQVMCAAASVLGGEALHAKLESTKEHWKRYADALANPKSKGADVFDVAAEYRALCLDLLGPSDGKPTTSSHADALLLKIGAMFSAEAELFGPPRTSPEFLVERDDRGVVVTLVTSPSKYRNRLQAVARVAEQSRAFPVSVVTFYADPREQAARSQTGKTAAEVFKSVGVEVKLESIQAPSKASWDRFSGERIEVVFNGTGGN